MSRSRSNADPEEILAFAIDAARVLRDDKCDDVTLLDVRGLSHVSDYVLIASGTSERQMKTAAQSAEVCAHTYTGDSSVRCVPARCMQQKLAKADDRDGM